MAKEAKRVIIIPSEVNPDQLVAYACHEDDQYGLASIAIEAIKNPEINAAWINLVRLVATEFFERLGFTISRFDVVNESELN